jgi:hypothetical protein
VAATAAMAVAKVAEAKDEEGEELVFPSPHKETKS